MHSKILISSCLLGNDVKYDGTNNKIQNSDFIKKLQEKDLLIPFCPEVEGGLPIPRSKAEIQKSKVITEHNQDVTREFILGSKRLVQIAKENDVKIAIMKYRSPSCGKGFVYDGTFSGTLVKGDGISVQALKSIGVQVFSELELEKVEKIFNFSK